MDRARNDKGRWRLPGDRDLEQVVLVWDDRLCRIEDLVAEGDLVANRWSFRAVGPDATALSMTGMDFYRVAGEKLVEEWIALGLPQ